MPPLVIKYPLDKTGINPNNLVVGEPHTLNNRNIRSIAPTYGAYYGSSIVIFDVINNRPLTSNQWYPGELYDVPTALYGQGVYALVIITDPMVGNDVTISYQAVGGEFSTSETAMVSMLSNLNLDNRPTNWPEIVNKPNAYPPSQHLHDAGDVYGFEYVVHAIERVRSAVELGSQISIDQLYLYVDQKNALSTAAGAAKNGNALNTFEVATATSPSDAVPLSQVQAIAAPLHGSPTLYFEVGPAADQFDAVPLSQVTSMINAAAGNNVTSINGVKGNFTIQAGTGVTFNYPNPNVLEISSVAASGGAVIPLTMATVVATKNTWLAQQTPFNGVLIDGVNITWDGDINGQTTYITLTGNRTMVAPLNIQQYGMYVLRVSQDAIGSRTLTWNAAYKFGTIGAPTLTTSSNGVDILSFLGGANNTLEFIGSRLSAV